jgi:hypothetical protein
MAPSPSLVPQLHLARVAELEALNAALLAASRAAAAEHATAVISLQSTIDQQTATHAVTVKQLTDATAALDAARLEVQALQTQMALDRVAAEQAAAQLKTTLTATLSSETSAEVVALRAKLVTQRQDSEEVLAALQTQVALDRVAAENAWAIERQSADEAAAALRTQTALDRVAFEVHKCLREKEESPIINHSNNGESL